MINDLPWTFSKIKEKFPSKTGEFNLQIVDFTLSSVTWKQNDRLYAIHVKVSLYGLDCSPGYGSCTGILLKSLFRDKITIFGKNISVQNVCFDFCEREVNRVD